VPGFEIRRGRELSFFPADLRFDRLVLLFEALKIRPRVGWSMWEVESSSYLSPIGSDDGHMGDEE
jgi:hypothetical protein